jgi:hypothetical protein
VEFNGTREGITGQDYCGGQSENIPARFDFSSLV